MKLKSILKGEAIILLFLLFVLQACSYQIVERKFPAVNEIKAGEKFTIILPENHTENYIWKINENRNKSLIDYLGAVWHGNEKGIYYNFTALKTGTDTLRFTQFKMQDTTKSAYYIIKVID